MKEKPFSCAVDLARSQKKFGDCFDLVLLGVGPASGKNVWVIIKVPS